MRLKSVKIKQTKNVHRKDNILIRILAYLNKQENKRIKKMADFV